jgi:hypothetical protein
MCFPAGCNPQAFKRVIVGSHCARLLIVVHSWPLPDHKHALGCRVFASVAQSPPYRPQPLGRQKRPRRRMPSNMRQPVLSWRPQYTCCDFAPFWRFPASGHSASTHCRADGGSATPSTFFDRAANGCLPLIWVCLGCSDSPLQPTPCSSGSAPSPRHLRDWYGRCRFPLKIISMVVSFAGRCSALFFSLFALLLFALSLVRSTPFHSLARSTPFHSPALSHFALIAFPVYISPCPSPKSVFPL